MLPRWKSESDTSSKQRSWSTRLGLCALVSLALVGLINIFNQAWQYTQSLNPTTCSCGSTPEEALSRACQFDELAMAWLPPHCIDSELTSMLNDIRINQSHQWNYYTYPNATAQLSIEEVSLLAGDPDSYPDKVVTTMDWHHSHCLYLIWKQARLGKSGVMMEGRYAEENHAMHCMSSVLEFIASRPEAGELLAVSQVDLYP